MEYSFEQLESFVIVAEEEHVGRAAVRLHMNQPQLSRRIQALEQRLGVELFDRRGRRIRLSAAGTAFLQEARRMLAIASAARDHVRMVAAGVRGEVHLAFTSVVGNAVLRQLLPLCAREAPGLELVLHEISTPEQAAALASRRVDVALGRAFVPADNIMSVPLRPDGLVIALPKDYLAEGEQFTSLRQIEGRPFVGYVRETPYMGDVVAAALVRASVRPRIVQRVVAAYTMLTLVDVGIGAAIVARSTTNWAGPNTSFVEAPELADFKVEATASWRRDSTNPAALHLVELIQRSERIETPLETSYLSE